MLTILAVITFLLNAYILFTVYSLPKLEKEVVLTLHKEMKNPLILYLCGFFLFFIGEVIGYIPVISLKLKYIAISCILLAGLLFVYKFRDLLLKTGIGLNEKTHITILYILVLFALMTGSAETIKQIISIPPLILFLSSYVVVFSAISVILITMGYLKIRAIPDYVNIDPVHVEKYFQKSIISVLMLCSVYIFDSWNDPEIRTVLEVLTATFYVYTVSSFGRYLNKLP